MLYGKVGYCRGIVLVTVPEKARPREAYFNRRQAAALL